MADAKRTQLKKKVAAGVARNQDRGRTTIFDRAGESAIEAKDRFTAFAKEHPITTVAGGVALGILVSGLFKRSPTRKLGKRAAGLAAIGAEFALAYAQQAMEAAGEAGRAARPKLEEFGETLGSSASDLGTAARDAGKRLSKALRNRAH